MSKFSNMLKMIILLQSRGKMKIRDIADILEVDERMVRKYKSDLEEAGVYINSMRGIDGGYELKNFDYLMKINIKDEELAALKFASMQFEGANFIYSKELQSLTDKISAVKNSQNKVKGNVNYFVKTNAESPNEGNRKKVLDIHNSILSKTKMEINYFALSSGENRRVIRPYAIISYKDSLYIVAYCEKRNALRDFKISRIKDYRMLNDKFIIPEKFSIKKYMNNNFGIYRDGVFNVKLHIYRPMSYIISEKIWVSNQKITWNEDKSIIFEAVMQGKTEIKSWILSMGSSVKVIEPQELKDIVKDEIKKTMDYY